MAGPLDPSPPLLLVPPALEVPLAAAGVCSGASGFGSFDILAVSASDILAVEFSINPITSDSGANQVVVSGPLCTQLLKS